MSQGANLVFNAVLILIATVIGSTFPKVGSILGYVGGFVGLGLIYIIPIMVYLKRYKLNLESPKLVKALDNNLIQSVTDLDQIDEGLTTTPKIGVLLSPDSTRLNKSDLIEDRTSLISSNSVELLYTDYKPYYIQ